MNPAPRAMKYFKYRRDHLRCATNDPPIRFAPAAVKPSKSASKIRVVSVEPIDQAGQSLTSRRSPLVTCHASLVTHHSSLPFSPRMPEQNHITFLHDVFFSFQ